MPATSVPIDRDRLSAHVGFLFTEQPLAERFGLAARAGFRAVEHPNPFSLPASQLRRLLSDAGLQLVQTAFPAGDPARGEKGFAALPSEVGRFRANVEPTLDYAEEVGCRLVHVMAAVRPPDVPPELVWTTYLENLAFAADAAARRSISILVEPIGPGSIANYVVNSTALGVQALHTIDRLNAKLLLDVFHAVSLGEDPIRHVRMHAALIGHVQIADYPGRHEPGTGTIDFAPVFAALSGAEYTGFIGCEYHPSARTEDGLTWMPLASPGRPQGTGGSA